MNQSSNTEQAWSALRTSLLRAVSRKLAPSDAEDVVQIALAEAFASKSAPEAPEDFQKWLWGIVRNKVADHFRKNKRMIPHGDALDPLAENVASGDAFGRARPSTSAEDVSAKQLYEWANAKLPANSEQAFEWLMREGEGETLEDIAREENIPAARVRKRVSRLRSHLREHWKTEVALLAALGVALALFWLFSTRTVKEDRPIVKDPSPGQPKTLPKSLPPELPSGDIADEMRIPEEAAADDLRKKAKAACEQGDLRGCKEALDKAKELAPGGEATDEVRALRKQLDAPAQVPSSVGTTTATPVIAKPAPPSSGVVSNATSTPKGKAPSKPGPTKNSGFSDSPSGTIDAPPMPSSISTEPSKPREGNKK
jgi:RNA polymerase sigma factor (sigma-70 family)